MLKAKDRRPLLVLFIMAVAYLGVLQVYQTPVPAGQDQSCYYGMAGLFVETGTFRYADFVDGETTGTFWVNNGRNEIVPVYAPGFPLVLAAARILGGEGAEYLVTPLAVLFLIFSVYALARCFLPSWYALFAVFLLLSSPTLFLNAQLMNTHVVGCLLTVWALLLAVFTRQWRSWGLWAVAAGCGLLMGAVTVVRYPDGLLLLVPPVFWLTGRYWVRERKRRGRRYGLPWLLPYALGALVPLGLLGWYHTEMFGAPWRTGYDLFNASVNGFSCRYFLDNLLVYLPGMVNYGLGPACVLALLWMLTGKGERRGGRWFWLAWLVPLPLLYHFYFWASPDSWHLTLRFWFNLFPGFAILGVLALRRFLRGIDKRQRRWLLGALIVVQTLWGVQFTAPKAEINAKYAAMALNQAEFLRVNLPESAWVIFNHALKESERNVYAEALFGIKHCHLFSSQIMTAETLQAATANELKARDTDAANTAQDARAREILRRNPVTWRREFGNRLRAAVSQGTPLFYFGDLKTAPGFMAAGREWFNYGEPLTVENIVPACVMFPQKRRQYNDPDRPVDIYPPLVLIPLSLKAAASAREMHHE